MDSTYLTLSSLGQEPIPVEIKKDDASAPKWVFYVGMAGALASILSLVLILKKKR